MDLKQRTSRRVRDVLFVVAWVVLAISGAGEAFAEQSEYQGRIGHDGCRPVKQRTGEIGCWTMINLSIGKLPAAPMFWHLDSYPSRATAEAAKGSRSAVVEALGKIWLFTIERAEWRSSDGVRVAEIGPLPVNPNAEYTARYMEAVFTPGMTSSIHRHSGPEVWYTLTGETCLETSEGKTIGRAGGTPVIVPGGLPMYLTATGTELRRALVLILYDSSQPASSPAHDWSPKGLCNKL